MAVTSNVLAEYMLSAPNHIFDADDFNCGTHVHTFSIFAPERYGIYVHCGRHIHF